MKVGKKLALIAASYALAVVGGLAAAALNDLMIPDDIQQTSGGMVAFGDMVVLFLATGVLALVPTWFLLKLCAETNPRILLAAELVIAVLGPISWLVVWALAAVSHPSSLLQAVGIVVGPLIAFVAIPRIVLGPVVIVIEALSLFLLRDRRARALLVAAMLMDVIPIGLFALHMIAAAYRYR
jgi:predicted neutral ceramidase superfamily lipid hydrolase